MQSGWLSSTEPVWNFLTSTELAGSVLVPLRIASTETVSWTPFLELPFGRTTVQNQYRNGPDGTESIWNHFSALDGDLSLSNETLGEHNVAK